MASNRIFKPKNAAAYQLKEKSRPLTVSSAPYTSPPKGCVSVQVVDVAINPIDWKMQENAVFPLHYPAIFGMDIAGEIVEVGKDVDEFRVGQRIIANASSYSSNDATRGAFQKYAIVPSTHIAELPYSIPTAQGVVLPLGISTASAGLFQKGFLALPLPSAKKGPKNLDRVVLVWGGSSSVGSCAIQLARRAGATVLTTASPSNFEYCRKLGAKSCFDYHDDDVEEQILKAIEEEGETVAGAYHATGGTKAVQACARIVDQAKGKAIVVSVAGETSEGIPDSVRVKGIAATSIWDKDNDVGRYIWREFLPVALDEGTIVPKPDPQIVGEELRSVQLGLDTQKKGVSASKVVVSNIS